MEKQTKPKRPISHYDRLSNEEYIPKCSCKKHTISILTNEEMMTDDGIIFTKSKYKVHDPSETLSKFKFRDFDLIKLQRTGAIDNLKPVNYDYDNLTASSMLTEQLSEIMSNESKEE